MAPCGVEARGDERVRRGAGGQVMRGMPPWIALGAFLLIFGLSQMASSQSVDRGFALLEAAARGDVETLKRQIAPGNSLDGANTSGETPLLLAVKNNHLSTAVLLIDAGANINAQASNK